MSRSRRLHTLDPHHAVFLHLMTYSCAHLLYFSPGGCLHTMIGKNGQNVQEVLSACNAQAGGSAACRAPETTGKMP